MRGKVMRGTVIKRGLLSAVLCLVANVALAHEPQAEIDRQLKEAARLQEIKAKQLERSRIQAERMERLLKRWESQADRYDKLLEQWEAQTGKQPGK